MTHTAHRVAPGLFLGGPNHEIESIEVTISNVFAQGTASGRGKKLGLSASGDVSILSTANLTRAQLTHL
jgi:hypothetical protein